MIKAIELRIGNYFNFSRKPESEQLVTITGVNEEYAVVSGGYWLN